MSISPELREAALVSKAWPYEEARKLLKRYPDGPGERGIVFETGYGPSGLPHLGTFQEVARTLMVRHALTEMVDWPSRLIAFSDDMDGMRKVPPGVPHQDMMHEHLDQPLSKVPDPFGCGHSSYADHNNAILRQFLDRFGFDYEFLASSDCYASGRFDEALKAVLLYYDAIMGVMLPTLGEERRRTYSAILPISPTSGKVLQVPVEIIDVESGLVAFDDEGTRVEQSILSGGAKLQWKVDWAMRWVALGVDYEMSGKDLIDSVTQSSKIARILGARPPEGFNYEMFLDENGEKISKTKGNGVTIDEWLAYAPEESLAFYIYRDPRKAKQLSISVIPKAVDEYYQFLAAYPDQPWDKRLGNPVHHVHAGKVPNVRLPITFALLLNVASLPGVGNRETIWSFLHRYNPDLTREASPELDRLVDYAVEYGCRFVAPALRRRAPTPDEARALRELDDRLAQDDGTGRADEDPAIILQNHVYEIGKKYYGKEGLRDWFKTLYETLLGSEQGPRMGSFIALYGVDNSRRLISEALAHIEAEVSGHQLEQFRESYDRLRIYLGQFSMITALDAVYRFAKFLQWGVPLPPRFDHPVMHGEHRWNIPLFEWELDTLLREIILNCPPYGGRSLDTWDAFSEAINHIKRVENDAWRFCKSDISILLEIFRIAHRQFHWQRTFGDRDIARHLKIYEHPQIRPLIIQEFGMTPIELYQIGLSLTGSLIGAMGIRVPVTNELNSVSPIALNNLIERLSLRYDDLGEITQQNQQYDVNWAYTFNPVWQYPLIALPTNEVLGPIPRLVLYRLTGGIFYDLVRMGKEFSNGLGPAFQDYVGEVLKSPAHGSSFDVLAEVRFGSKGASKDSIDWIVADNSGTLFVECKASRLKLEAKVDLHTRDVLVTELKRLASFVTQSYVTLADALAGRYPHWELRGLPVYPIVVTIDEWFAFGERIEEMLDIEIREGLAARSMDLEILETHPFQIWSIHDFENAVQAMALTSIQEFMAVKTKGEVRRWPIQNVLADYIRERGLSLGELFPGFLERLEPEGGAETA